MATPTTIDDLVERNKELAKSYTPRPFFTEFAAMGIPMPKILIVTCADPRCVPESFLGLKGAEAAVFRNVCGHVGPEMHHILALDTIINFDEIMIVHHNDCGGFLINDEQVRKVLKERVPEHTAEVDKFATFGGITDLEQSIRDDIAVLKASPLMRKDLVNATRGFTFDIKTGMLNPLDI
ncbi:carbonic anhydrase [Rhizodiscina lignyota]|uniref:Carbonic anhydrase n=1 Tax=Rhizodiscina lignyota TaxID=1504668 RepID=A0A9P4IFP2_9PEZI|nr:carbonic anhydrase [Rhizodiscina lignyota]